jgi:hypothetical protein
MKSQLLKISMRWNIPLSSLDLHRRLDNNLKAVEQLALKLKNTI